MPKHTFQDEHIVRASLQRCLESSVVVPTMFWTEAPNMPGKAYTPVSRETGHALGIHGRGVNMGTSVQDLDVVDLSGSTNASCSTVGAVLPFSEKLWLFQERASPLGESLVEKTIVLLPDGKPVTLRAVRRYAQSTPQYASWLANPHLATPWCTAPTLQLLTNQLRSGKTK